MRVLVDINHPAHVHNLRHVIRALEERGHTCRVTARPKDVTLALLEGYGIPATVLAPMGQGRLGQLRELVVREARFLAFAREFRPDLILGSSVHAARAGLLFGARSVLLNEDDAVVIRLYRWLAYPFATAVLTPDCLAHQRHGARHLTYPSYHELLYLHPNRFTPDPSVRRELGLAADESYALVRLSALEAHHDAGVRGISRDLLRQIVQRCEGRFRVFVTGERPLDAELERYRLPIRPDRIHDALAFADFFVGDSQTMTLEAAVLGTPAFQLNDLFGRLSVPKQLAEYGLCFGFRPGQEAELLTALFGVIDREDRRELFKERRRRLLADKIDPLPWIVDTVIAIAAS